MPENEKPPSKSFYPGSGELAEANLVLESWQHKPDGCELWFVFVSVHEGEQQQRFVYSFNMPLDVAASDIVACAEVLHKEANRPAMVEPVEVLQVTQEIVDRLKRKRVYEKDKGLCDFCAAKAVLVMTYSARDFVMQDGRMSEGGWKACDTCATLIDAGNRVGLAERIAEIAKGKMVRPGEFAARQVADFFAHRLFQ